MYTEQTVIAQICVDAVSNVSVRTDTLVFKDGVLLTISAHRDMFNPGADLTGQDQKVQAVAAAAWAHP